MEQEINTRSSRFNNTVGSKGWNYQEITGSFDLFKLLGQYFVVPGACPGRTRSALRANSSKRPQKITLQGRVGANRKSTDWKRVRQSIANIPTVSVEDFEKTLVKRHAGRSRQKLVRSEFIQTRTRRSGKSNYRTYSQLNSILN